MKTLVGFLVAIFLIFGSVGIAMSQITISSFRSGGFKTGNFSTRHEAKGESCLAIGAACAAAMEGLARQPEAETKIRGALMEFSERIQNLNLRCETHHVAEAMGLAAEQQVAGLSRQPEAEGKLRDLADLCEALLKDQL